MNKFLFIFIVKFITNYTRCLNIEKNKCPTFTIVNTIAFDYYNSNLLKLYRDTNSLRACRSGRCINVKREIKSDIRDECVDKTRLHCLNFIFDVRIIYCRSTDRCAELNIITAQAFGADTAATAYYVMYLIWS